MHVMRTVLETEKPDFVVVTGDVVSGYAWDGKTPGWFAQVYKNFTIPLYEHNMHWAFTAGNHDSQADLTREEISEVDRSYNLSVTLPNAGNLSHALNFMLPIYDQNGTNVAFRFWFLDSGDESCMGVHGYDCVMPD